MDHRKKRICVAKIVSAHGVKGEVKVKSFTNNAKDFNNYGQLFDHNDVAINLKIISVKGDIVISGLENVLDRDQAQSFVGKNLFIDRNTLPSPQEDEFYIEDLVGLDVVSQDNKQCGIVRYIHNFGGGDIIEIHFQGDHHQMVAFTKENFPEINFQKNFIKTSLF